MSYTATCPHCLTLQIIEPAQVPARCPLCFGPTSLRHLTEPLDPVNPHHHDQYPAYDAIPADLTPTTET